MAKNKPNFQKKQRGKPTFSSTNSTKSYKSAKPKKRTNLTESELKTKNQITSVILFATSIFLDCVILIKGEHFWTFLHNFILGMFGVSSFLWPIILIYVAFTLALSKPIKKISTKIYLAITTVFLFGTTTYLFSNEGKYPSGNYFKNLALLYQNGVNNKGTGLVSGILGIPSVLSFGEIGAKVIILLLLFVSIMILTGTSLLQLFRAVSKPVEVVKNMNETRLNKRQNNSVNIDIPIDFDDSFNYEQNHKMKLDNLKKASSAMNDEETLNEKKKNSNRLGNQDLEFFDSINSGLNSKQDEKYNYPSPMLLEKSLEQSSSDIAKELQTNGKMLVDTLENFSVHTKIINISRGPAVTRYELQPAAGVKISKITSLADDIALNFAASGVRIEAPIPGKAAVGIEIPNKLTSVVKMRELVTSREFLNAKSKLSVILGRDIAGNVQVTDLAKMPHLLIAGSTGSGKSVCINSFIISLLYKSSPEEVKLLMIDPKVVELGIYNGIPHLLVPVVTDPRKAAGALNWAVTEMLKRYQMFADNNVRDLHSYNRLIKAKLKTATDEEKDELEVLPQIVIIIDELADLMMVAPNEVEDAICRLAQMARAAGMHLVIATQRPSVDVITGIIKANIPSRIALAVSSQVDSRTILDTSGAEKLLGRGDMLFSPIGSQKSTRIQGCFVSDKEIESVIDFVKKSKEQDYDSNIMDEIEKNAVIDAKDKNKNSDLDEGEDPMINEAIDCIMEFGQASTSFLQRKLRLGYARAGRIMDQLESRGVVGPSNGAKPRQILLSQQRWQEQKNENENF